MKFKILLILILFLILAAFVLSFIYWSKDKKSTETSIPSAEELQKLKEEELAQYKLKHPEEIDSAPKLSPIITSCDEFSAVEGAISCQEAKEIVSNKYSGEIYQIKNPAAENIFWIIYLQTQNGKTEFLLDINGNIVRAVKQ